MQIVPDATCSTAPGEVAPTDITEYRNELRNRLPRPLLILSQSSASAKGETSDPRLTVDAKNDCIQISHTAAVKTVSQPMPKGRYRVPVQDSSIQDGGPIQMHKVGFYFTSDPDPTAWFAMS